MSDNYPPEPDDACKEASKKVIASLNGGLSALVTNSGLMGLHDTIRAAKDRINNLTSSYLYACADNDRLRQALSEAERRVKEARVKALEEAALRIDCNCNERCLSQSDYCPKQNVAAIRSLKDEVR